MSRQYCIKYKHNTSYFMCSSTFNDNSLFSNDTMRIKPNTTCEIAKNTICERHLRFYEH